MNTYERYLEDYSHKSTKAIHGRKTAIWNRIKKSTNWEEQIRRGWHSEPLEALRALDDLLTQRSLEAQQTEKENAQ